MDQDKIQRIAQVLTEYFFTNGVGDRGDQLKIILPGGRDGGGWSAKAMKEHIVRILGEVT